MEIKNLKKAAKRILQAIKDKENIIIYGDADLDGVSSVIILKESIKTLGGEISALYFPDRETEGYGITETGLKFLGNKAPALLIAIDCGISNFKEVVLAKKLGFEVIIVDHHEILDKLPRARIIVDPKQKGDKTSFKKLAAVGLAFKLSLVLLKDKMTAALRNNFLELVAIATIADSMPREGENEIFIEEGLSSLAKTWRPGLKAFLENREIKEYPHLPQKISKMISILNVRDVKIRLPAAFRLLASIDYNSAKKLVVELLEKNKIKKEKMSVIQAEIEDRITKKAEPFVFEVDPDFELNLLGAVASYLCQKYGKPVFLGKKMGKIIHGSIRSPSSINVVDLMHHCQKLLLTYGGHPQAAGFRLKSENLDKFKSCLTKQLTNR